MPWPTAGCSSRMATTATSPHLGWPSIDGIEHSDARGYELFHQLYTPVAVYPSPDGDTATSTSVRPARASRRTIRLSSTKPPLLRRI